MTSKSTRFAGVAVVACGAIVLLAAATGRGAAQAVPGTPSIAERIARLDGGVRQVEGIRAARRLQHAYAHYQELGLWDDMADLFAVNGVAFVDGTPVTGRSNIRAALIKAGGGRAGLEPGRYNAHFVMEPVVTFDPDGRTLRARWHVLGMVGEHGVSASWLGGIFENSYIEENGRWTIASLREYPMFAARYEDNGWTETPEGAPFHYDPKRAGTPVSMAAAASLGRPAAAQLPAQHAQILDVVRRLERLKDEAAVINLQHSYGYYVDRKLWDDVADLLTPDATMELDARGVYVGKASIRKALEQFGPPGLQEGQLHDHLQLQPYVSVSADGQTAMARGVELRMTGVAGQRGDWGQGIFENEYVKRDGRWMIKSVHVYPRMFAEYSKSWKEASAVPRPSREFPPDRPASASYQAYPAVQYPAFHFANPVTGLDVRYPAGARPLVRTSTAVRASASRVAPADPAIDAARIEALVTEAERWLAQAIGYDGSENVANAYGYYIDGFLWDETADLFSTDGWKELSYIGTYVGRERVRASMKMRYGNRNGRTRGGSFAMHQKTQPVVTVAADGKSARIRTRLFQLGGTAWIGGIYENQTVLEDGVWKISGMDLDYVWTGSYRGGWAGVGPNDSRRFAPAAPPPIAPDRPLRGVQYAPFPSIAEMGFHYANPVSGRAPALLLP